jgi:hypothetical protein
MIVANRKDFLACLDQYTVRNELEVFAHAKRHLLAAVDEVSFDDFVGHDYEVMGRLREALDGQGSEASLWGQAFIDLWYCSNFGRSHWADLVARDSANARYAIQAAHWVFAVSGANEAPALAAILNRFRCWEVAQQCVSLQSSNGLRSWWEECVLPLRERGIAND